MKEISVAVIAHGLGTSKGYSGEGYVYKTVFEMLEEHKIDFIAVSVGKPYDSTLKAEYLFPFHIRRFDKYQRLLVYLPAKRLKPKVFLNVSGTILPLSSIAPHIIYAGAPAISSVPSKYSRSLFWKLYLLPFKFVITRMKDEAKKARIIANSYYSAKAIAETYSIPLPEVIYPPVDVEFYSKAFTEDKENYFVTIGRFERGKMLENSIIFSSLSGIKGILIGSLNDKKYFNELVKLKEKLKANVEFLPNLPREEVLKVLSRARLYFHPTIGEHFGIPIVEAMATGAIPIVPKESGGSEVVPEFSYSNIEEAVSIAKQIMTERATNLSKEMYERAKKFSKEVFKNKMYEVLYEYLK